MTEGTGESSADSDESNDSDGPTPREMGDCEPEYLKDTQLENIENDDLGHRVHVDLLESIIWNNNTPWHIGVFGTWGSGKTSVIDLLFNRIEEARNGGYTFDTEGQSITRDFEPEDDESGNSSSAVSSDTTTDGNEIDNKPNYPFANIACVKIDAWQHSVDSIQTSLILDLNKDLAKETTKWNETGLFPERHVKNFFRRFDRVPYPTFFHSFGKPELLDSDAILSTLHDVEEREDNSIIDSIVPTLKDLVIQLFVLLIALLVLSSVVNDILGTTTRQLLQFGVISLFISTALRIILTTSSMTGRTMVNPRQEWSGAYKELFDRIVSEAEVRYEATHNEPLEQIVIVIDDLDRCESKAVYETLVALKSFLEHRKCTYIIPCDDDALYEHLKASDDGKYLSDKTNQRDFLAKFFDTQVPITAPEETHLEHFAREKLNEVSLSYAEEIVSEVLIKADLRTPRRVILALNRTLTLQALVKRRDLDSIDIRNRGHMLFIAKMAIFQEDFPEFLDALKKGRTSLSDLIEPYEDQPSHSEVENKLTDVGITGKQARRLAMFLIETSEISEPIDPYLNLSGDEVNPKQQFARALVGGRQRDLNQRIQSAKAPDKDYSIPDYCDVVVEQLKDNTIDADTFHTAVEIGTSFDEPQKDRIWMHAYESLDTHQARSDILRNLDLENLKYLVDTDRDNEKIADIIEWLIKASITEDIIDRTTLERIFKFVGRREQQFNEVDLSDAREEFADRLNDARSRGQLKEVDYRKLVDRVSRNCLPLYSYKLVRGESK